MIAVRNRSLSCTVASKVGEAQARRVVAGGWICVRVGCVRVVALLSSSRLVCPAGGVSVSVGVFVRSFGRSVGAVASQRQLRYALTVRRTERTSAHTGPNAPIGEPADTAPYEPSQRRATQRRAAAEAPCSTHRRSPPGRSWIDLPPRAVGSKVRVANGLVATVKSGARAGIVPCWAGCAGPPLEPLVGWSLSPSLYVHRMVRVSAWNISARRSTSSGVVSNRCA